MKIKNIFLVGLLLFLYNSCVLEPTDPDVIIEDPVAALLIFPENNTECNEGTILSDTQSDVVFRWNASDHTDSYEVVLTNLETLTDSRIEAITNFKEITLERGTSYEWYVNSKSTESKVATSSDTFQFFNASPGVVNHVPFSAEAITPENDEEITTTTGKVTLEWEAVDIDNDIKDYEVLFGTDKDQLLSQGVQIATSLEVDVISGASYFWMINTHDESNNTSTSDLFSFSVQ